MHLFFFFFLVPILFGLLPKPSFAAATFFTQVIIDNEVHEFEMEIGGTYAKKIYNWHLDRPPFRALNIVYSESDHVSCFLRGYFMSGRRDEYSLSALARYMSPVYLKKKKITYDELICYDISDNLDAVVLLLHGRGSYQPTQQGVHKLSLDENREGVLLPSGPTKGVRMAIVTLLDSPYRKLWCKVGRKYSREDTIGYRGSSRVLDVTVKAIPCTTKPRPQPEPAPPGFLSSRDRYQPEYVAMDKHFKKLVKAEKKNKAAGMNTDDPDMVEEGINLTGVDDSDIV